MENHQKNTREEGAAPPSETRRQIISGIQRAVPIIISYIPIGFTYGVIAKQAGIADYNVLLMSLLVFAGSSQLIGVEMIRGGAGAAAIIITAFVVNLRHLLMTASLAPAVSKWKRLQLLLFSAEITDETFAVNAGRGEDLQRYKAEAFSVNITSHLSWLIGAFLGIFASTLIPDIKPLGLDFALAGMFIGLIVLQVDSMAKLATALFAGVLGTVLYCCGLQQLYIIIATFMAATFGLGIELWYAKRSR